MGGMANKYCDLINDNFGGVYYPTWLPSVSMLLGDYGILDDDVFTKQGNIRDFGIKFKAELGSKFPDFEYKSQGVSSLDVSAGFEDFVNVGLKFKFTRKFDTFFVAAGCQQSLMLGQPMVMNKARAAFATNGMKNYYIVVEVMKADATTILIASDKNAEYAVEAKSPDIPKIDLKNPSLAISQKKATNMGFKMAAAPGLTPLVALSDKIA
jgi:hypothetical protein